MALSQEKRYTVDDIYNLPEGIRAELIDGEMYMMAAPGTRHQEISGFLYANIYNYIRAQRGDCKAFPAAYYIPIRIR